MAEILVEVRQRRADAGDLGPLTTVREKLSERIAGIGDALKDVAQNLSSRLEELETSYNKNWRLNEAELKFSIDLETEAGVIIARTKTGAAFEVALTWKRAAPEKPE